MFLPARNMFCYWLGKLGFLVASIIESSELEATGKFLCFSSKVAFPYGY